MAEIERYDEWAESQANSYSLAPSDPRNSAKYGAYRAYRDVVRRIEEMGP